jgi:hypothetical protein
METIKIKRLSDFNGVKVFFDPLRKEDSFLMSIKGGEMKSGFVTNEILLESNFHLKWEQLSSIIAGFSSVETLQKIKDKIDEQAK